MMHIDLDAAIEAVEKAVLAKGEDYVYDRPEGRHWCVYVHEGQPSCIVGHALTYLGVPLDALAKADGATGGRWFEPVSEELAMDGIAYFTHEATGFLAYAQQRQDDGYPWGEAFRDARYLAFRVRG